MRRFKRVSWVLMVGLLVAACASAAGEPSSYPPPEQTPYPAQESPAVTTNATSSLESKPTATSTPSGAWINLSPAAGGPGTAVRIDGYLPGGLPEEVLKQDNYRTHADLCWGGCQNGLTESALDVIWSAQEPGHFNAQFVVPEIPWLAADGVHRLEPGDYAVDLLSLDPNATDCSPTTDAAEGCLVSAVFHLAQGHHGLECQEAASCGYLQASPAEGAPGEVIQVQGWAPLLQIIGQPSGYDLVLEIQTGDSAQNLIRLAAGPGEAVQQAMKGELSASFRVPQYAHDGSALSPGSYTLALQALGLSAGKNASTRLVAPTPFEIKAAPAWIQRQRFAPFWIQPGASVMDQMLGIDVLNSNRLAYCSEGAIQLSQDAGQSWVAIPTTPISDQALPDDLILDNRQPICRSVLLDSGHPDSLFAAFGAMNEEYGIPPVYFLPFYTNDGGTTWQALPQPAVRATSTSVEGLFGGFWTDGKVVHALYYGDSSDPAQPRLLVEQTLDGGVTWKPADLTCPSSGPCLRGGPEPGQISGMGSDLSQDILSSYDQSQTWSSTPEKVELRFSSPDELVALSQEEALIIASGEGYPLRYTSDGGRTWQALALPHFPGVNRNWQSSFPGLQMLPNGNLLALNLDTGLWWALPSDAQDWCPLEISSPNKTPVLLQASGDRLWWFSARTGELESAPVSSFSCTP